MYNNTAAVVTTHNTYTRQVRIFYTAAVLLLLLYRYIYCCIYLVPVMVQQSTYRSTSTFVFCLFTTTAVPMYLRLRCISSSCV